MVSTRAPEKSLDEDLPPFLTAGVNGRILVSGGVSGRNGVLVAAAAVLEPAYAIASGALAFCCREPRLPGGKTARRTVLYLGEINDKQAAGRKMLEASAEAGKRSP